jgi:hypothetical protein
MYRELERTPAINLFEQQRLFDTWKVEYNFERPHEALGMKKPAECYTPSPRLYNPNEVDDVYPSNFRIFKVDDNGRIHWTKRQLPLTLALAHEAVGVESLPDAKLRVWYCDFWLGDTDKDFSSRLVRPADGVDSQEYDRTEDTKGCAQKEN